VCVCVCVCVCVPPGATHKTICLPTQNKDHQFFINPTASSLSFFTQHSVAGISNDSTVCSL